MAYEKQTWISYDDNKTEEQNIKDGAVVTAERMNHIEDGVEAQATKIEFDSHLDDKGNPHEVTAHQVGALTAEETSTNVINIVTGKKEVELTFVLDLKDKIAGSDVENKHSYRYVSLTDGILPATPIVGTEVGNTGDWEDYGLLYDLDNKIFTTTTATAGKSAAHVARWNLLEEVKEFLGDKFFTAIGATDVASQVAFIRSKGTSPVGNTWGFGSSASGNKLSCGMYRQRDKDWPYNSLNTQNSVKKMSSNINPSSIPFYIADDGFVTEIAYAGPSDGVTQSATRVDYSNLEFKMKISMSEYFNSLIAAYSGENIDKKFVGLENVDNYGTATQAEAESGTATDKFMTPLRTKQHVSSRIATQTEAEAAFNEERFMVPRTTRNLVDRNFGQAFTSGTKFIAHRGNSYFYPENSLMAFEKTTRHWGAETDIQLSTDGKWYCFHDKTVDRMTNGTGNFMDKTSSQIDALRLDTGNGISTLSDAEKKIPTFDQYLNACLKARIVPVIEITPLKTDFTDAQLDSIVTTIRRKGLENKCVIICFTYDVLVKMRKRMPSTVMHWLLSDYTSDVLEKCIENHFVPSFESTKSFVTQSLVDQYHDSGLDVGVWVVPYSDHQKYAEMGLDYISTNDPSGNLRYFEPALRSGMQPNNVNLVGPTYIEETSNGEIHIRVNVTAGQNDVGIYICALESWAIPRHSLTLIGYVRSTKVTGLTFVPVSVGVGGYSANDSSIADANIKFGYLTTGTNWKQRATYAAFDLFYRI